MIFPIGDDNIIGGHKPLVAYSFLGFNIAVFLFELSLSQSQCEWFMTQYGVIPTEISAGQDLFTIITSMFMHGGWMHLIGNMIFLWIFADNIEAVIGSFGFLVFYLLGGVVASLIHVVFNLGSTVPSIGASGAISAVMGAYLVMFPKSRIKVIVLIFFFTFHLSAIAFLGIWFIQQLFSGIGSLNAQVGSGGVAWWAHIGGFLYGVLAGFVLKNIYGHRYNYGKRENV
ncbi:MAG: rhomboid family intramembrane serine protease [Bacteroidia bacterium]|nr:rhomboid family intramembrane serine protease [Bacteroidia bacterium]